MGDFIPITRTKVILPRRRAELLSRSRLLGLLDELLDNRLIILAAPAGYGKTSLLVDFAYSSQWPMCWYSLDTLDQDPFRFVAHFISAISQRFPNFGKTCMAALQSMSQDRLDLDVLASLIINDLYENVTEHFVVVLDDFHLVEGSSSIVYFVNRFVQDVDENCHLVLASRTLLTLPDLPLMVARSQVGGLSFEELCFQPEEIQGLLKQNFQLTLSDAEVQELARETEGWVTGLLLSTQVMGKPIANRLRVARVSGVGLYEYLAQQVLAQQTEDVQAFLLRSSLLEEFDARLCEEVIGKALSVQPAWRELMDVVMRFNLFILPVGEDGAYLRYHHLFQDFLRDRIQRERPQEVRQILVRLAEIYIEREDWERAFAIYQAQGDTDAIVRLVNRAGSSMIIHGRLLTLTQWLKSLPNDLFYRHPTLISLQGTVNVMRGDTAQGIKLLDQAVSELKGLDQPMQLAQTLSRRCAAFRVSGQYPAALRDAEEVICLLSSDNQDSVEYADGLLSKGVILTYLGQLNEALLLMQDALSVYSVFNDGNTSAKAWMEIGRVSRALGKYSEAEEAYRKSLEYYQSTNNLIWQANLYNNLGILLHGRKNYVEATSSFEKAIHYAKIGGSPRLEAYTLTSIGDLYQELDAYQETFEAYRQAREIAQRIKDRYLLYYLDLAEARLRQTQSAATRAREMLKAAQSLAQERGSAYELKMVQLEWGRVKLAEGDCVQALVDFQDALAFFLKEGYQVEIPRARLYVLLTSLHLGEEEEAAGQVRELETLLDDGERIIPLLTAGREVKDLLEKLSRKNTQAGFVSNLLESIERYEQGIPSLRRVIRRHAVVVPFAPPKMVIRALGRIQVKVSDHQVSSSDWQVQTARDLFFLLLAHPEGLSKEEIGELFWPDSSTSELKLRFKNTIYRLRHAAGKDAILFQGESLYLFNREMDYEYDVESFQKEIGLAEKGETREQREVHYLNALKHYKGPFLPDLDDTWVIVERERLNQVYMEALLKLANLYLEAHAYDSAIELCQRALKDDSCQEDAHRTAMRVYAAIGNRALIIRQYEQCRVALLNEVDAPPSFQTQALFDALIQ